MILPVCNDKYKFFYSDKRIEIDESPVSFCKNGTLIRNLSNYKYYQPA